MYIKRLSRDEFISKKTEIVDLLNQVFKGEKVYSNEYIDWKYLSGDELISYAAFDDDENIIGLRLIFNFYEPYLDSDVKIIQPADSAVKNEFHGRGIFNKLNLKFLDDLKARNDDFIVMNFPNHNSINVYRKLGWNNEKIFSWHTGFIAWSFKKSLGVIHPLKKSSLNFIDNNKLRQFILWRFCEHPTNDYYIYSLRKSYIVFKIEYKGYFKVCRVILIVLNEERIEVINDFLKGLSNINVRFITFLDSYKTFTNHFLKECICFKRKRKLNCLVNTSVSTKSINQIHLYHSDFI